MAEYGWRNDQGWRGDERRHWDQNQNRMRGYGPWSQGWQGQDEFGDEDRYAQSRFGGDGHRWDRDDWRGSERDYPEQDYGTGYATPIGSGQGRFGSYGQGDWRNQGRNYYTGSGYGGSMGSGYMGRGYMGGGYMGGGYVGGPMGYGGYGDWQGRSYMGEARNRFASPGYGRDFDRSREYDRNFWNKASDEVASWVGDDEAGRRREMDRMRGHAGRGPKGYTRSDDRIREDANDRLTDDWQLDASNIEVHVSNGEVTLTGTVENRFDKRRAEDLVDNISGVHNVQNNLRVQAQTMGSTAESQSGSHQARQGSSTGTSTTSTH